MAQIVGTEYLDELYGTDQSDQIFGLQRSDTIYGQGQADRLYGEADRDHLFGGLGNDTIYGGFQDDKLYGEDGNDRLFGGSGSDTLNAGSGADHIDGGDGIDIVSYRNATGPIVLDLSGIIPSSGETANDTLISIEGIYGSDFVDLLIGDSNNNVFYTTINTDGYSKSGEDTVYGRDGNDYLSGWGTLFGENGNDTIEGSDPYLTFRTEAFGGDGDDFIRAAATSHGGAGDDSIVAGNDDHVVFGDAGNDTIDATYGHITVNAGSGDDYVWTDGLHAGSSVFFSGSGNDTAAIYGYYDLSPRAVDGGVGTDVLVFFHGIAPGRFRINFDAFDDSQTIGNIEIADFEQFYIFATCYSSVMKLGAFADTAQMWFGDDLLRGRGGNDYLMGNEGDDTIFGDTGDDILIGGGARNGSGDILRGGAGNDIVYGNYYSADYDSISLLSGGDGSDTFVFFPVGTFTRDRVMDFEPSEDRIALSFSHYAYMDAAVDRFLPMRKWAVTETDALLTFNCRPYRADGYEQSLIKVSYNKETGILKWEYVEDVHAPATIICRIIGAPDLDVSNFGGLG